MRFQAQHPLVALLYYCELFAALFLFDSLFYTAVILIWMMPAGQRAHGERCAFWAARFCLAGCSWC